MLNKVLFWAAVVCGIIAGIANVIAEANVNILDISQSVIREFFTMIMMVDLSTASISFAGRTSRPEVLVNA